MSSIKTYKPVTYFEGFSQSSARSAVLAWTDEDRLILDLVDENNIPTKRIFELDIEEVVFGGSMAILWFLVDGRKHRIDFTRNARLALAAGGIAGTVISNEIVKNAGVIEWVNSLTAYGATNKYMSFGKLMGISVGLGLGIVLMVIVIVVISSVVQH